MPELTPFHFLIVCPLVFLAGFVDSIAGGGGLISLPAYLLSGLPVHACIATNKLSSSMGTALTTAKYARAGYIDARLSVCCVVVTLIGASIGANLALLLSDSLFRIVMLIILPLTALYVLRNKHVFDESALVPLPFLTTAAVASLVAFVVGMYDGFYGPGTGTFLILLLTRFAHMGIRRANGLSKVINLTSNCTSLVVYLLNAQVLLPLGLAAGVFSLAGNWLGARSFTQKGAAVVRPIILIVLTVFFIRTLLEITGVLA